MLRRHIFRTIITFALITFFYDCQQVGNSRPCKGIQVPNYEKEEKEFLEQIVFNDSTLDSLLVWTTPESIDLRELYLKTPGMDSASIPKDWKMNYTDVSDSEMIQIYQQFTAYQYIKWTQEKLYGHKVLTMDDWKILVDKRNEEGKYQYNESD